MKNISGTEQQTMIFGWTEQKLKFIYIKNSWRADSLGPLIRVHFFALEEAI